MSKKILASSLAAGVVGLASGIAGLVSYLISPSAPTSEKAVVVPPSKVVTVEDFHKQLQAACANGDLRGTWVTSVEKKDNKVKLHGVVDEKPQRDAVEKKANELLADMASADWPRESDANNMRPREWTSLLKKMQETWSEPGSDAVDTKPEERQLRRQTRLDAVYIVYPDKLVFTGACLAGGNVQDAIEKWVRDHWREAMKAPEAAEAANTKLAIDTSQIKRFKNPVLALEDAAKQAGKPSRLNLDWAWYDKEGRLNLKGAVPHKSDLQDFQQLIKTFAPQWQEAGVVRPDAGLTAEKVVPLDVAKLHQTLQAQFASSDNPLRNSTRLDGFSFERHPLQGLQLRFQALCTYSPTKEERERLPSLLKGEVESALKQLLPQGQPFAVALPANDTFKTNLLKELQDKVTQDKAHLRGVLVSDVHFDERGMADPRIVNKNNPPEKKKRVEELLAPMLGKPKIPTGSEEEELEQQGREEEQEEEAPPEPDQEFEGFERVLPALWKEMARDPKWRHVHIDNVEAVTVADVGNTLQFTGVWLYKGSRPTEEAKKEFNKYFSARAKELLVPYLDKVPSAFAPLQLEVVESPLPRLCEQVMHNKDLEGFVFLEAYFTQDGKLRISGYYKAKEGKEDKEQLGKCEALFKDERIVAPAALGKRLDKRQTADLSELKPIDYSLFKMALQKRLAGAREAVLGRSRLDEVVFQYDAESKEPVLSMKGVCLATEAEAIRKSLGDALKEGAAAYLKKPFTGRLVLDLHFQENPVPRLQAAVTNDPRLDGVLVKSARFNDNGQLELQVLTEEEQQALVTDFFKKSKEGSAAKFAISDWLPRGTKWAEVAPKMQAHLASTKDDLLNQTRVDRLYFAYDGPDSTLCLHVKGVCIKEKKKEDELRKQLQDQFTDYLKTNYPSLLQAIDRDERKQLLMLRQLEFKEFPLKALQDRINQAKVRGALLQGARYDANGKLEPLGGKPSSKKEQLRLEEVLQEGLKDTGIFRPPPSTPARGEPGKESPPPSEKRSGHGRQQSFVSLDAGAGADAVPPALSLDQLVVLDWDGLLEGLRKQFAAPRSEALFRQTRVDDAEFRYVDDDPKVRLTMKILTLLPPGTPANHRRRLQQQIEQYFKDNLLLKLPRLDFQVELPADARLFQPDPTVPLQHFAANYESLDGVLFLAAWYDPERRLNFDVIYDKTAGHEEQIKGLLARNTMARRVLQQASLPDDSEVEPRLHPKTFVKWQEQRRILQRKFASSDNPLLEKTRIGRLYFDYAGTTTADCRLRTEGVCLAAGDAVNNRKKLATAFEKYLGLPLFGEHLGLPLRFTATPDEDGVGRKIHQVPSPLIRLQQLAIGGEFDGVLFDQAFFDSDGVLHLGCYLTDLKDQPRAAEVVADWTRQEGRTTLGTEPGQNKPVLQSPRPFPWRAQSPASDGIRERLQAAFASSEVAAARQSGIDRAYFLYETNEERRLHLEGVSLWAGRPEELAQQLTTVSRQVLPAPEHKVAERMAQKPNPAPALQESLAGKEPYDGMLFEDAGYDAGGRLHFPVLVANDEQEKKALQLLENPPLAAGVRPLSPQRRDIQRTLRRFDWATMLTQVRVHAAGQPSGSDLRRTRLERAYFARPQGKCLLRFVGVSLVPGSDDPAEIAAIRKRLADQLKARCDSQLTSLKLQVAAVEGEANFLKLWNRDLGIAAQRMIAEQRLLDGTYVKDAGFDAEGKIVPEGAWIGDRQAAELERLLRAILGPQAERFAAENGFAWSGMRVLRTDVLLGDLRTWVIEKTNAEELLIDRAFFNASGLLTIHGYFVAAGGSLEDVEKGMQQFLALHPVARPLLSGPPGERGVEAAPPPLPAERLRFREWQSVAAYLRGRVPQDARMDGLRVDRCYFDREGLYVLSGLEDQANQSRLLDPLLRIIKPRGDFQLQLARTWRYGTFAQVPLARMLRCLARAMPGDALFDGVTLARGFHNAEGRLVLAGYTVGRPPRPEMQTLLLRLLAVDPAWSPRLQGGPLTYFQTVATDRLLSGKILWDAVSLFVAGKEEEATRELNTALLHTPGDMTLWYFRAICNAALGEDALVERDLRRFLVLRQESGTAFGTSAAFASVDSPKLERIQGGARQKVGNLANRLALDPLGNKPLVEMLPIYCAEPARPIRSRLSAFTPLYVQPCLCPFGFCFP